MNPAQHLLVFLARGYRTLISPALTAIFGPLGFGCRFTPTCSQYAIDAVKSHGAIKGCGLTLGRLCRCQPWGGSGFDPVPQDQKGHSCGIAATVRSHEDLSNGDSETSPDFAAPASRGLTVTATLKNCPKGPLPLNPAQHGS